ncbi:bacterio-opsin activator domain-containing protein [Halobellus ordinarius]|uniref:bacterio-opsin activator domain-containing protein n=1 Tax=Halobellus ordinarius TaxID=3075120 RepID=UPI002880217E|nr:bacterio-opsin activator domain-containing protein [Halobellus sp. ZY16]
MSTDRTSGETEKGSDSGVDDPVVLVVDDDRDLTDTCAYWLREEYDVRVAYGGEEALEKMDDTVDVVLLDRRMPDLSGDEVLEAIDDRGFDCRVAMMTAVDPDTDIVEMPFDEYLVKPVGQDGLRETVEELLVRSEFDEEVREYFALESTEEALDTRKAGDLGDPAALEALTERIRDLKQKRASEIERRQEQLTRVRRINELLRDVDGALVDATTREDIETAVCSAFESSPYRGAWIARYEATLGTVEPRATTDAVDIDAIRDRGADGDRQPVALDVVRDAVDDGAVATTTVTDGSVPVIDTGGDTAEGGYDVVAVPIRYRESTYGALVVYVSGILTDEERSVLGEIGGTIGNGIDAATSKELLYSDSAVELEFDHTDTRDVVVDLSLEFDTTVRLENVAPAGDGAVSCYLTIEDVEAEQVLSAVGSLEALVEARIVSEESNEVLFELRLTDASVLVTLTELGATVESFTATGGEGTLVLRTPAGSDLRALTDAIQSSYPDVSVVAKREVEDDVQSPTSFRRQLEAKLTDRQRDVMETAMVSGYFEWPRGSTAEEVAESLGISAPTFHEHLRSGERKLVESFFAEAKGSRAKRDVENAAGDD